MKNTEADSPDNTVQKPKASGELHFSSQPFTHKKKMRVTGETFSPAILDSVAVQ